MRQSVRVLVLVLLLALLGGVTVGGDGQVLAPSASAQEPTPPPNPSDDELDDSAGAVATTAGEVGRLSARLSELDAQADELAIELQSRREDAEAALAALDSAQAAAAEARQAAEDAEVATRAATSAIDDARSRLDEFVTATYQQGIDLGPLGLLTTAQTPEDLVAHAEFTDLIARTQLQVQDGLERARVDQANAESLARQARDEAAAREAEARDAQEVADVALSVARDASAAQEQLLAQVDAERASVQAQLDAAVSADDTLRGQRDRYDRWQAEQERLEREREAAERAAAAAREAERARQAERAVPPPSRGDPPREDDAPRRTAPSARVGGSAGVERVIDRAMSQLGVQYVWGGGNGRGPSTGIPDAFGSPLNRVGFDCSGLMLYAFNGAGISLPRVSRSQYHAGPHVPISQLRRGDMVFYRRGGAPIHHVALYLGDGRMIEAPYTGSEVRVVPLRRTNLVSQAVRMF